MIAELPITDLPAAVSAMDRLNSYARTFGCNGNLKSHIYAMKDRCLKSVDHAGALMARPVYVVVSCGKCGGSGVWNTRFESRCWACSGHGKIRLYFRESVIGKTLSCQNWPLDDIRWHTPIKERQAGPEPEQVTDWKPRTPGREMTPDEVAAALNITESKWSPYETGFGSYYFFHLGEQPGGCCFCGAARPTDGNTALTLTERGRFHWSAYVCEECRLHYDSLRTEYGQDLVRARMPLPKELFTPEIQKWVERHGGVQACLNRKLDHVYW